MRPEALAAMLPYLTEQSGNPSGSHAVARRARDAVEDSREIVARHLGCAPSEVVFTSGGTEACNLALLGAHRALGGEVRCSAFEHHAVLDCCASLGARTVPVGADGLIDLDALSASLHPGVRLVSVMLVNNEVGTVQPIAAAVRLVRERAPEALFHTDAVAAGAWLDLAAAAVGADVDLVSVGAHKFGGPKGAGALVVRDRVRLGKVLYGGAQERERRPGTHNVAAIAGMAAALDAAVRLRGEEAARVRSSRDRLAGGLVEAVPGLQVTALLAPRLPGICHVRIDGADQEELLLLLDEEGVRASGGSACASGAIEPSHVLLAMGFSRVEARQAVRFSLGWNTTDEDVELALGAVPKSVERLRRS
jgi:cysteine desulfurase